MEFELPKINVSFEYDEEKDEIVFVINGVEKRVKTEDMITEMEKLQEQNTALEQQPCEDAISRRAVLDLCDSKDSEYKVIHFKEDVECLPPVKPQEPCEKWIPISERLPEELEPVNITWINRNPESYYADIKDKPFTATGVYFNGQWYWWSTLCTDILAEYSHNYDDTIHDDIEIIAWMPLPEPYRAERNDKE